MRDIGKADTDDIMGYDIAKSHQFNMESKSG